VIYIIFNIWNELSTRQISVMASFVTEQPIRDEQVCPHMSQVCVVEVEETEWQWSFLAARRTLAASIAAPRIDSLHCSTPPSKQTCPRPEFPTSYDRGCMNWNLHATDPRISCAGLQHDALYLVVGRIATVSVFLCQACGRCDRTIEIGFVVEWLLCRRCHTSL